MAKFIRFEADGNWCGIRGASYEMRVFLSQSSRRLGEMIVFLRALRNIRDVLASAQVFQFMYVEKNLFYYKEILHYATLRSEWHGSVFYLRLGIWIIFETQRFFIIPMFLRKQSRNSLANWWSVCFKMFFPNVFIYVVASTGSATDCGKFIGLGNKMNSL